MELDIYWFWVFFCSGVLILLTIVFFGIRYINGLVKENNELREENSNLLTENTVFLGQQAQKNNGKSKILPADQPIHYLPIGPDRNLSPFEE
ncbi:MAG: hypothetical protein WCP18_03905 [bacterium]